MAAGHRMENIPNRALYYHRHHAHKVSLQNLKEQNRATEQVRAIAASVLQ